MAVPDAITASQLSRLIGTPDCPLIVDVRTDEDVAADPRSPCQRPPAEIIVQSHPGPATTPAGRSR